MSDRRLSAFLDALAAGRRPKRFRAEPEDAELARTAITLRAARPGDDAPSDAFVESLFQQLSEQAKPEPVPEPRLPIRHRVRIALVAVSSAGALVAGTVVTTLALDGPATSIASHVPHGSALRTGTFQTTDGRVLGQIVAYHGKPSWVFMNVSVPSYNGQVKCMLQVEDGTTVAFGTFDVHSGVGQFSKALGDVDISKLRGAKLVTTAGAPVADATFAA
jgi:hypothetical protein